ncbi:sensor histidine kinase [Anaerocellum diazotrophicum]|uniref:histidine kinase n=1 Tax=Caldicellulosiruptor diazotrophicus TaxID=2806205 RepID=A0ABN6EC93_9FIRM|nr:histidine kinase [Caldicellulosiruptor diazotrophicus]BCS82089.1 hypothetical protein CaldiYA01_20490 [Caldicellulosiruptor diazotrophicus]
MINVMKMIMQKILKGSIWRKFFFLNLCFMAFPLIAVNIISYMTIAKTLEYNTKYAAFKNFEQTCSYLSYKINNIVQECLPMIVNNDLRTILVSDSETYEKDPLALFKAAKSLKMYIQEYEKKDDIYKIRLYVDERLKVLCDNRNVFSISDIDSSLWYKKINNSFTSYILIPSQYLKGDHTYLEQTDLPITSTISIIFKIVDLYDYNKIVGYLRCDLKKEDIISILKNGTSSKNDIMWIENKDGIVVAATSKLFFPMSIKGMLNKENNNILERIVITKGIKYFLLSSLIEGTDWCLVAAIPLSEIRKEAQEVFLFAFVGITTTVMAFLISLKNGKAITDKINKLAAQMRNVKKGEILPLTHLRTEDNEIGSLIDSYNYMANKIKELMEQQYRLGMEKKSVELKLLQSQINPHFLYNTLDMINWYARMYKCFDIVDIVESLAKFYKMSLKTETEVVSIREEIEHVNYYFSIQNKRFGNQLRLMVEIPKELLDYEIPRVTLQPLVENSIQHGIMNKKERTGNIRIWAKREENIINIFVEDDGIGVEEEKLLALKEGLVPSSGYGGIGLKNINQRIKTLYGNEYGLDFEHNSLGGLTVIITLPAHKMV